MQAGVIFALVNYPQGGVDMAAFRRFARLLFMVTGVGALATILLLAVFANPATVTLNVLYSVTGFSVGFFYALYLYDFPDRTVEASFRKVRRGR